MKPKAEPVMRAEITRKDDYFTVEYVDKAGQWKARVGSYLWDDIRRSIKHMQELWPFMVVNSGPGVWPIDCTEHGCTGLPKYSCPKCFQLVCGDHYEGARASCTACCVRSYEEGRGA